MQILFYFFTDIHNIGLLIIEYKPLLILQH